MVKSLQDANVTIEVLSIVLYTFSCSPLGSVTPIPASQFAKHVRRMHFHGDMGFEKEYEKVQNDPTGEDNIAREHYSKNRYLNIFTCKINIIMP